MISNFNYLKNYKNLKVLITGSAGFIGSALCLQLLKRGDEIIGIDNHNDYYDPKIKDIQIKYGPNRAGDIPHSLASIDKAKNLLNYNPQYSLKQGLQEAVKWYWNNL